MRLNRREFLASAAATALLPRAAPAAAGFPGTLCLFSKHLPMLGWKELAQAVRGLGLPGIDLTVRTGGHVRPERAETDLPEAIRTIRGEGVEVPMITTELLSATPLAQSVLSTAGRLGIPFFKAGYYRYKFVDVRRELEEAGKEFRALAGLAAQCGIQVGYHNHANYLGAPVWDMARIMDGLDSKWAGYYFDICHAVTEGGGAGWKIALNLVAPRIKMIAVKDFYWNRSEGRAWRPRLCPLGEGMVDWKAYFALLAQSGFRGPVSLHLEYEITGATEAALRENTLAAARRDLDFLRARIGEAFA